MTTEQLKTTPNQRPFHPFTLHLADGRGIAVQHSEFAMLSLSGRTMVVYQADDAMNIVDLLLVTDLEMAANGKRRKR